MNDSNLAFAVPEEGVERLTSSQLRDLGWTAAQALDPATLDYARRLGGADIGSPLVNHVFAAAAGLPTDGPVAVGLAFGDARAAAIAPDDQVSPGEAATIDCVVVCGGERPGAVWVKDGARALLVSTAALSVQLVGTFHERLGLYRIRGEFDTPATSAVSCEVDWRAGVVAARVVLAADMSGASRAMLEIARRHAGQRVQFGRPIGAFQAVQHRLAEVCVQLEATDRLVDLADTDPVLAAAAKMSAGQLADIAAKTTQQVLGGVGFTAACDYHRYAKRVLLLDKLCGSSAQLATSLGEFLIGVGDVPRLPRLSLKRAADSLGQPQLMPPQRPSNEKGSRSR